MFNSILQITEGQKITSAWGKTSISWRGQGVVIGHLEKIQDFHYPDISPAESDSLVFQSTNLNITEFQGMYIYKLPKWRLGRTCLPMHKTKRCGFHPWMGETPWRKAWQPTPVFLPGKSHGRRTLVGYGTQGHKESDMTEVTQHSTVHILSIYQKLYI